MASLIRRFSRKQHGTENNRSWLSTCSQVIRPWHLKVQHGKPRHTFKKLDVPAVHCTESREDRHALCFEWQQDAFEALFASTSICLGLKASLLGGGGGGAGLGNFYRPGIF